MVLQGEGRSYLDEGFKCTTSSILSSSMRIMIFSWAAGLGTAMSTTTTTTTSRWWLMLVGNLV